MTITTVIFDFGGVITSSPFEAFSNLEKARNVPQNSVRRINSINADNNAWARFERAEIDIAQFDQAFTDEAQALGIDGLTGNDVLACLAGDIRPQMVAKLDTLKAQGFALGCITNNVPAGGDGGPKGSGMAMTEEQAAQITKIMSRFDHVIESSKVGLRKPDPRIYQMMCEALNVTPQQCVYLDDLGINCKPAAKLGMNAIKVISAEQALADLDALLP
jgi:putative hydrolase of the HAD superfamily